MGVGGVNNLFPITLTYNGGIPNDTYAKVYAELQKIANGRLDFTIDSGLIFIDLTSFTVMGSNNYEVTTVSYDNGGYQLVNLETDPEITIIELSSDGIIRVRYI